MKKSIFLLIPVSIFILLSCSSNTDYEQRMVYDVYSYAFDLDLSPDANQIAYLSDYYTGVT